MYLPGTGRFKKALSHWKEIYDGGLAVSFLGSLLVAWGLIPTLGLLICVSGSIRKDDSGYMGEMGDWGGSVRFIVFRLMVGFGVVWEVVRLVLWCWCEWLTLTHRFQVRERGCECCG